MREDIIKLAREAGFEIGYVTGAIYAPTPCCKEIERFAALVANSEREACCAIVFGQCGSDNVAQRTVDAIRARDNNCS
jgi:hypothetical protein